MPTTQPDRLVGPRPARLARILVGIGTVVLFLSVLGNVYQSRTYHDETIKRQVEIIGILNEHTATLTEVKTLRSELIAEVNSVIPQLKAGQRTLIVQYNALIIQMDAICTHTGWCTPVPTTPLPPGGK